MKGLKYISTQKQIWSFDTTNFSEKENFDTKQIQNKISTPYTNFTKTIFSTWKKDKIKKKTFAGFDCHFRVYFELIISLVGWIIEVEIGTEPR